MPKVTFTHINYKNYGKCVVISNGIAEAFVTTDLGPRVIKYNLIGEKNVFFEDVNRQVFKSNDEFKKIFGEGRVWYLYGGHRFWVSPEAMPQTYYPDNDKVTIEMLEQDGTLLLKSDVQVHTGWQLSMKITMSQTSPQMSVTHILENRSGETKCGAIWAISVLSSGGVCVVPMSQIDTGLLPNRQVVLWPYSKVNDERFSMDNDYIALEHITGIGKPFKFAVNNTKGKALYYNDGCVFEKSYDTDFEKAYPDSGVNTEVYCCDKYLELESLGNLTNINNGDKIVHTEQWNLKSFCSNSDKRNLSMQLANLL